MSLFGGHDAELQARELGACLRDAALRDVSIEHMAVEAERLRRAVTQTAQSNRERGNSHKKTAWLLAAAAGLLLVLGAGGWERRSQKNASLAFEVIGPGRVSASHVAAPESASTLLKFTDGSTVVAHQGARLRVPELRADGATLMLERGRATVEVVHRDPSTRWTIVAGPFSIAVTGTKFDVEWEPATERLSVDMLEGRIEVDGPKFRAPATMRGGQHIEANSHNATWAVTPLLEAKSSSADSSDPRAASPDPRSEISPLGASTKVAEVRPPKNAMAPTSYPSTAAGVPSAAPAPSASSASRPEARSWSRMVAQGESPKVVAEADTMGIQTCLGQCGSLDLRALADAARYSGRLDLAEASLRALRDRFPTQAAVAAYLLGAVDEARGRNAAALRWYGECVSVAPRGGFASEALAGQLRMLVATNNFASARKAARQYLGLYPNGVGARTAKQVLESR